MALPMQALNELANELSRFERERNLWEEERSELRAKLDASEAECDQMKALQTQLMTRIKMLEHCLKQARLISGNGGGGKAKGISLPIANQSNANGASTSDGGGNNNTGGSGGANLVANGVAGEHSGFSKAPSSSISSEMSSQQLSSAGSPHSKTLSRKSSRRKYDTLPSNFSVPSSPSADKSRRNSLTGGTSTSRQILREFLAEMGYMDKVPKSTSIKSKDNTVKQLEGKVEAKPVVSFNPREREDASNSVVAASSTSIEKSLGAKLTQSNSFVGVDDDVSVETSVVSVDTFQKPSSEPSEAQSATLSSSGSKQPVPSRQSFPTSIEMSFPALGNTSPVYSKYKTVATLRAHLDVVRSLDFHPEEPLAVSASDDGMVKVWNLARVKRQGDLRSAILQDPVRTCYSHTGAALCVAAESLTGKFFASGGSDGIVRLWAVPTGRSAIAGRPSTKSERDGYMYRKYRLTGHDDAVWSIFAADNLVATASADGTARLWRLDDNANNNMTSRKRKDVPESLVLRKDDLSDVPTSILLPGSMATSLSRSTAILGYRSGDVACWDLTTGAIIGSTESANHNDKTSTKASTNCVSLHKTMPLLYAARADGSLQAYDMRCYKAVSMFNAHTSGTSSVSMHPGGFFVASGSVDGNVRVWDIRTVSFLPFFKLGFVQAHVMFCLHLFNTDCLHYQ